MQYTKIQARRSPYFSCHKVPSWLFVWSCPPETKLAETWCCHHWVKLSWNCICCRPEIEGLQNSIGSFIWCSNLNELFDKIVDIYWLYRSFESVKSPKWPSCRYNWRFSKCKWSGFMSFQIKPSMADKATIFQIIRISNIYIYNDTWKSFLIIDHWLFPFLDD